MALDHNQQTLTLNTLYKVDALSESDIQRDLAASLWVNDGSVDLYGSDSATQPTSLAEMTLNAGDTGIEGKRQILTVCNYIAVVQNTGTTTEIILSGVSRGGSESGLGAIS